MRTDLEQLRRKTHDAKRRYLAAKQGHPGYAARLRREWTTLQNKVLHETLLTLKLHLESQNTTDGTQPHPNPPKQRA